MLTEMEERSETNSNQGLIYLFIYLYYLFFILS